MAFKNLWRWIRFNLMYLGRPPWDTGVSPPELKRVLDEKPAGRALDVGCGTGTNLVTMAQYGWSVVGMDMAWLSVLRARAKLQKAGINARVIHGDVTGEPGLDQTFDLVLDIGCYHSLSPGGRKDYVSNLNRWLKSGGCYLLYAHRKDSDGAEHGVTDDDLEQFKAFLDQCWREDSDERRPDGGGGRPATWACFVKPKQT